MSDRKIKSIHVNSIRSQTPSGRELYMFCVDSKSLVAFSSVLHASRDEDFRLTAYQRPEVKAHIEEIAEYLKSTDSVLPNAIVTALDPKMSFWSGYPRQSTGLGEIGELEIRYTSTQPAAWIIDGQQRTMALKSANLDRYPVFVTAIRDADESFQRQQFVNVNSVKPLPRALLYEMLPYLERVPKKLSSQEVPSVIAELLSIDLQSPFLGSVRFKTGNVDPNTNPMIEFSSIVSGMSAVLKRKDGFLSRKLRSPDKRKIQECLQYQLRFWKVVKSEFFAAWGKNPRESRLMHGVGIHAMIMFSDEIAKEFRRIPNDDEIQKAVSSVAEDLAWTSGQWKNIDGIGGELLWNSLQNTSADKALLTAFIIRKWRTRRIQQ